MESNGNGARLAYVARETVIKLLIPAAVGAATAFVAVGRYAEQLHQVQVEGQMRATQIVELQTRQLAMVRMSDYQGWVVYGIAKKIGMEDVPAPPRPATD